MKEMEKILENVAINFWLGNFSRSAHQINKPHEADAELIEVEGDDTHLFAITIDSVTEEITKGLYRNPYTMGWVTVMSNFSDLAAVGADPLGIVIVISIEPERDEKFKKGIAKGMENACRALVVSILGGDTNTTPITALTGCALGRVPRNELITRVGCRPGDIVFLSNGAGTGNAMGFIHFAHLPEELFPEEFYRPFARIEEAKVIRKFATCCMDTSDGLLITLDQLLRINKLGFIIDAGWEKILAPEVFTLCEKAKIPHWFMAAGIHGEFELIFTIPPEKIDLFLRAAKDIDFRPIKLGTVQEKPTLEIAMASGRKTEIDMAPLRNLWVTAGIDLEHLIQEHRAWAKKWGLE